MSNAKHTPGPWEIEYDYAICMGDQVVSRAIAPDTATTEEANANSVLIAAAPDLLAACEAAANELAAPLSVGDVRARPAAEQLRHRMNLVRASLRAAIARAKGED